MQIIRIYRYSLKKCSYYAGLNILGDVRYPNNDFMGIDEYEHYLDNPQMRVITVFPHLGINYGLYPEENEYWIVGQVERTDISDYLPTFTLPAGAIIKRIEDENNLLDPTLQSDNLRGDFTAGSTDDISYVWYRVYAEAHTLTNNYYTDYFVAVQDMTNTVYFELEILLANGLTNADLEKVFVTFNYYELLENNQTVRTNSMSLFSMFESGTQLGDNLRFESTKGGQYQILLDYGLEYNNFTYNIVAYGNTSGYVEVDPNDPSQVYITSHIIPRTYYLRITISKNTNIPWGQNETTEFQLTP